MGAAIGENALHESPEALTPVGEYKNSFIGRLRKSLAVSAVVVMAACGGSDSEPITMSTSPDVVAGGESAGARDIIAADADTDTEINEGDVDILEPDEIGAITNRQLSTDVCAIFNTSLANSFFTDLEPGYADNYPDEVYCGYSSYTNIWVQDVSYSEVEEDSALGDIATITSLVLEEPEYFFAGDHLEVRTEDVAGLGDAAVYVWASMADGGTSQDVHWSKGGIIYSLSYDNWGEGAPMDNKKDSLISVAQEIEQKHQA